jgi:hypothetical protein
VRIPTTDGATSTIPTGGMMYANYLVIINQVVGYIGIVTAVV